MKISSNLTFQERSAEAVSCGPWWAFLWGTFYHSWVFPSLGHQNWELSKHNSGLPFAPQNHCFGVSHMSNQLSGFGSLSTKITATCWSVALDTVGSLDHLLVSTDQHWFGPWETKRLPCGAYSYWERQRVNNMHKVGRLYKCYRRRELWGKLV